MVLDTDTPEEIKPTEQTQQQAVNIENPSVSDAPSAQDTSPASFTSTPVPDTSNAQDTSTSQNTDKSEKSPAFEWLNAVFDPPFSTANALFSTKVPALAAYARIIVKPYDPNVRISYTINDKNADPEKMELAEGENIIIVHVLSADGLYARKYTIKVLREPAPAVPTPQPEQTPEPSAE